jgi:hygromycin-B 7''-O-kinase
MPDNRSVFGVEVPATERYEEFFRDDIWLEVGREICREAGVQWDQVVRSEQGENVVLLVDDQFVIKIYKPSRRGFGRETVALEFASGKTSLPLPEIVASGRFEGYDYLITTQIHGRLITRDMWLRLEKLEQVELIVQLASGLRGLHSHAPAKIDFDWNVFLNHQLETVVERQRAAGANPEWLAQLPRFLEDNLPLLNATHSDVFLHGDVHFGNLRLVENGGHPRISGLFDFSDSLRGHREYEFVAPGVLIIQGQGELQREFLRTYGYADADINEELRSRLMLLTILYECSSLKKYALRLRPEAVNYSLYELEKAIWNFA